MANWFQRAWEPVAAVFRRGVTVDATALGPDGSPPPALRSEIDHTPERRPLPTIAPDPAITIASDFKTVPQVKGIVTALALGNIQLGALLVEQMLWSLRLRGIAETRLNGMIAAKVRWEPSVQNPAGRRAAKDIESDWPKIAPAPVRKQLHRWGLLLGVGLAQKHWYTSPTSGRRIPRLEVYHPQWANWNWSYRCYQIFTLGGMRFVLSPSLSLPGQPWTPPTPTTAPPTGGFDDPRLWVVHEPWGTYSWREGLVMALWSTWLGHNLADRDMSRASEKLGRAMMKVFLPQGVDADASQKLLRAMTNLDGEAVIPLMDLGRDEQGVERKYDVMPLEYGGVGFDMIERTKGSKATDMAVGLLGHNLTTEVKGASFAAANIGDYIRGDYRGNDAESEKNTYERQVIEDWAEENYGDRELAPIMIAETDPPAINQAGAQVLNQVAQAISVLRQWAPGVDFDALLARFRIPVTAGGIGAALPPKPGKPDPTKPDPAEAMASEIGHVAARLEERGLPEASAAVLEAWATVAMNLNLALVAQESP